MNALYWLFIFIRSKPEEPIHIEILNVFQRHFDKDNRFYKTKNLINDLENLEENVYKKAIVKALKKSDFKPRKFAIIRVSRSIPVIKDILLHLRIKIENQEFDKARVMASAVHNYPHFLINNYRCNSKEFWEAHIRYYFRTYGEEFLTEWGYFFQDFYPNN